MKRRKQSKRRIRPPATGKINHGHRQESRTAGIRGLRQLTFEQPRPTPKDATEAYPEAIDEAIARGVEIPPSIQVANTIGMDEDGHGHFRDLCLVYGDFYRSVFLEEIINFVHSATTIKEELTRIRKAIRETAARLRRHRRGGKGRPRGENNPNWLVKAKVEAWQKYVFGWSWEKIAEAADLKPTEANRWTLQRRQNQYAEFLLKVIGPNRHGWDLERLKRNLEGKRLQQWLWSNAYLPFKKHPEGCKKVVLALISPHFELRDNFFKHRK